MVDSDQGKETTLCGKAAVRGCIGQVGGVRDKAQARRPSMRRWRDSPTVSVRSRLAARTARLSATEERALAERIRAGDAAAQEQLILANLALVLRAVRGFKQQGVPTDDLIQEGNLGLIRAAQSFDPHMYASRFATYAAVWIRASLLRAIVTNNMIVHIPERLQLLLLRYDRALERLTKAPRSDASGVVGGHPSAEDIACHLGISVNRAEHLQVTHINRGLIESTGELLWAGERSPDEELEKEEYISLIEHSLRQLSPFESWVIRERFGLAAPLTRYIGSDVPSGPVNARRSTIIKTATSAATKHQSRRLLRSYVQLSRDCGLTAHRIRQVEQAALDKLRDFLKPRLAQTFFN